MGLVYLAAKWWSIKLPGSGAIAKPVLDYKI
jgi:hypothetical protein